MAASEQQRIHELERQVQVLSHLAAISATLNSRVQLEPLLQHIMDVAAEITDCESASVLLWNNKTNELFFAATTSQSAASARLISKPVPMDSIAGTILRSNQIVQVDDASSDPRHYRKFDEEMAFQTRSLLGVPMTSKDRVIGVLEAINKRSLPWKEEDREMLSILAAQAAVAIENAQLIMDLKRANAELSELDKLKNDFIAIASHELRTPLGVIMGYASFLQIEAQDESSQNHATKVLESALKLRKIIEDMVNLRYIKQNSADLQRQRVPVNTLLRNFERDTVGMASEIGERKVRVVPFGDQLNLLVDEPRLQMALAAIFDNAISFTSPDGQIALEAIRHSQSELRLVMTDNGIGIPEEHQDRIFDEFYQVEDHMTRHHGGLGIGLSIARAVVRAHGGRIWAESKGVGQGARIVIALRIDQG